MDQGYNETDYERDEYELERRRLMRLEMKRKQQWYRRIAVIALVVILGIAILLLCRGCRKQEAEQTQQEEKKQEVQQEVRREVEKVKATLSAVGDIMCYDNQIADAKRADGTYDFTPAFAAVSPYLRGSDLTVGNLELNFAGSAAGYSGYPSFNAPESLAAALADAGFDLLQTANTYSIQNGFSGLSSTIRTLEDAGISPVGTYGVEYTKKEHSGVVIREVNGIRFAFLGFTKGVNNLTLPDSAPWCVDLLYTDYATNYSQINRDALLNSVNAAKELGANVIVAMLHWGSEYELEATSSQEQIATLLFQNGVDVILGSHSHEVGPMEMRTVSVDGKEKKVFLAYSLGNFFSAMTRDTTQATCVLNLEFTMDPETGVTEITGADYLPVLMTDKGASAALRYELLPIRTALASGLFPDMEEAFNSTLETLAKHTKSTFDSGK